MKVNNFGEVGGRTIQGIKSRFLQGILKLFDARFLGNESYPHIFEAMA